MISRVQHILFWSIYVIVRIAAFGLYSMEFSAVTIQVLTEVPISMALTYYLSYRIIPSYLSQPRWGLIVQSLLIIALAMLIKRLNMQYVLFPMLYAEQDFTFQFFDWYRLAGYFLEFIGVLGLFNAFKFYHDYIREKRKANELSKEKRIAQLQVLKAQVNPHFLFNTLNSIYNESIKGSERTSELILEVSDLLRFVLEECSKEEIPLEREIQLIRNYIEIEKTRHHPYFDCELQVEGPLHRHIPPMLIFSLVENAYKHCISGSTEHAKVSISIISELDHVTVKVQNDIPSGSLDVEPKHSLGLGLKNTISQLDLIYGEDYQYHVDKSKNIYQCVLQIPFTDHA